MSRRPHPIDPAVASPGSSRAIAALFTGIGAIGAIPGAFLLVVTLSMLGGAGAMQVGEPEWFGTLGAAAWLILGFVQWLFHLRRAVRREGTLPHARFWWLLTFVYNATYATGCAAMACLDPHPGTVISTLWFVVLSIFAVIGLREDDVRH